MCLERGAIHRHTLLTRLGVCYQDHMLFSTLTTLHRFQKKTILLSMLSDLIEIAG